MDDLQKLNSRVSTLEGSLEDVRNWKDPRNTAQAIESLRERISGFSERQDRLESAIKAIKNSGVIPSVTSDTLLVKGAEIEGLDVIVKDAVTEAIKDLVPKRKYTKRK